jgi:hypothetical protein
MIKSEPTFNSMQSASLFQTKILDEFLYNEMDYVRNLSHIIDGYYKKCLDSNMFRSEEMDHIFSNIIIIYKFHKSFLRGLKRVISTESVAQVAELFKTHVNQFFIYKQYCSNFARSTNYLNLILQINEYRDFFNKCRCTVNTLRLPLSSYLLGPVQRICKYPLQIQTLLTVSLLYIKFYSLATS